MFTFCALQGALSESPASQSLLELDGGVKVLIDLGWDESFDATKLKDLEKCVASSWSPPHNKGSIIKAEDSADSEVDTDKSRRCR
jgi:hypothetical protein